MTERKPPSMGFESWIDKQIREAQDRGDFDDLPGAGKPIPGHGRPDDELWWVKDYLRREGVSTEAMLPTSLRLRLEVERLPETVRSLRSERAVRDAVAALNDRIARWLRMPTEPHVHLEPLDADEVVRQWRAARGSPPASGPADATSPTAAQPADTAAPARRRRWWRRRSG